MTEVQAAMGLRADQVNRVLTAAARAPSVHNTQPWRFHLTPSAIELHADPERRLKVADPDGVEMRMSCGAALFNMRMALIRLGVLPAVTRMPDPAQPELLASICHAGHKQPNPAEAALAHAITRRDTNRRSFSDDPVSTAHQHNLRAAAHREQARLYLLDATARGQLGELSIRANRMQLGDPAFRAELAAWSGDTGRRTDGVPARTGGPAATARDAWVLRDFTGGHPPEPAGHTGYEEAPLIAVLSVYTGGPDCDLRAGEALQRVLLGATVDGLSVSLVSQLIEVPETRELTRQLVGSSQPPHAVLRIGYGWPVATSPRRAVDDLVTSGSATDGFASFNDPHDLSQLW
jgi:nitroreductase